MAEKLKTLLESFHKAHSQLQKSLEQPCNEFIRDSSIQRFEFTFELFWKVLKAYAEFEGKDIHSPRAAIKEAFILEVIDDDIHYLQMLEDRNNTVHTYKEELAEQIYSRLDQYSTRMKNSVSRVEKKIQQ